MPATIVCLGRAGEVLSPILIAILCSELSESKFASFNYHRSGESCPRRWGRESSNFELLLPGDEQQVGSVLLSNESRRLPRRAKLNYSSARSRHTKCRTLSQSSLSYLSERFSRSTVFGHTHTSRQFTFKKVQNQTPSERNRLGTSLGLAKNKNKFEMTTFDSFREIKFIFFLGLL